MWIRWKQREAPVSSGMEWQKLKMGKRKEVSINGQAVRRKSRQGLVGGSIWKKGEKEESVRILIIPVNHAMTGWNKEGRSWAVSMEGKITSVLDRRKKKQYTEIHVEMLIKHRNRVRGWERGLSRRQVWVTRHLLCYLVRAPELSWVQG